MEKYKLLIILFLFFSCNRNTELQNRIIGEWHIEDGTKITINCELITFNNSNDDYLNYSIQEDSIVILTTQTGDSWKGKLVEYSSKHLVYFDSLFDKKIQLEK